MNPWRHTPYSALLLLCLLAQPALTWAETLRYRVEGAGQEARANIRAYLGESPDSEVDAERFLLTAKTRAADALRALGFYAHAVELEVDRSSMPWRAVLQVREGEPLRYTSVQLEVQGEGAADQALRDLADRQRPDVGDVLHHGRYEDLKTALQQLARRRGYFDARFTENRIAIDLGAREASLQLSFDAGRRYQFGKLVYESDELAPEFLQRLLPFELGDPYSQDALLEFRNRLLRLGFFASVIVLPEVSARRYPEVPISLEVVASPRHSYELGVGFSTDTRQRVSFTWNTPRINAAGHSQETRLRWSPVNPEARVTYSIPLDDPANDVLQLLARLENNEFGDLDSRQREFQLRREFSTPAQVLAMHARSLHEEWGVFSSDFSGDYLLTGVTLSRRARSGRAVDPSRGLSQHVSVEIAGRDVGSDEDLLRVQAEFAGIRRFAEHWRVVARAEAGILWSSSRRANVLPPSLAFFAGGDNSIRGYAYQSVGPQVSADTLTSGNSARALVVGGSKLVTGSLELQRYINDSWRAAVFVDGGDAFTEDFDLNVGLGIGVHYLSPVGALRLEIANPVSERDGNWRLHVNIGAEF